MRFTGLLILLLSFNKSIVASAQLVERQPQELWPDWGLGGVLWDGLTFLRGADLFRDPQDSDSSKTKPPPDTDTNSDMQTPTDSPEVAPASPPSSATSPPTEPVYKININKDPSLLPDSEPNSPAILPSVNEECDLNLININDADCSKTTDQLVFTTSCAGISLNQVISDEARAQNQAIRETLDVMNGENTLAGRGGRGLRISTSHICDVYFFAVPLTESQIRDIEKKPGVRIVRPNQALDTEELPGSSNLKDSDPVEIPALVSPGGRLKKRDQIVSDGSAAEDLRFISTPRNSALLSSYIYYSNGGRGVTVFAVDSGVNVYHDDFVNVDDESTFLGDRIEAMDTSWLPDDYDGMGTCRTSKIVGRTFGVARRAKVVITKISGEVSSAIDVLVQVGNYLSGKFRSLRKELVLGYYVMSILIQWDNRDPDLTSEFEGMLEFLITEFQLVVVVPAGDDRTYGGSDINMWPATTERRNDIIVVGAVEVKTGRTYAFSRGGPFLTVNAPGMVTCARNQAGSASMVRRGTDVAATQVAGLVAYFLSLDDVGPYLRQDPAKIPERVKSFVKTVAAYKRLDDDFPAIWNLLGSSTYY